jgi:DNA-directed RNA polymerase subunit RPC12/RpoP
MASYLCSKCGSRLEGVRRAFDPDEALIMAGVWGTTAVVLFLLLWSFAPWPYWLLSPLLVIVVSRVTWIRYYRFMAFKCSGCGSLFTRSHVVGASAVVPTNPTVERDARKSGARPSL